MSGIYAVFGSSEHPGEESDFIGMRRASRRRGADVDATWSSQGSWIGVCRFQWEMAADFADGVLVLRDGDLVVAADASLYYRDDLRKALRAANVAPTGSSPSHLIAAAYRAWGSAGVARLEGDFAFVLWDQGQRRLVAARDLHGSRPLFYGRAGDQLAVASCLSGVAAHHGISRALNLTALTASISDISSTHIDETEFRGISRVPAGCMLQWKPGSAPLLTRFDEAPIFEQADGLAPEEGAERLLEVLGRAVRERLGASGLSTVWMSGGYDSPAVFALARTSSGAGQEVVPVSMSYPIGDKGREDELIEQVAGHYGAPVTWVLRANVLGLPNPIEWAAKRDESKAHSYEYWNRALMAGTRSLGARIALSGNGGDQFFGVSGIFLGDLLRRRQWGEFRRELHALGANAGSIRSIFHWAVKPNLSPGLLELAGWLRGGRRLGQHLHRRIPAWIGADRAMLEEVQKRQYQFARRRPGESLASAEAAWYLHTSFGQQIISILGGVALDCGIEVRSPMYDRRVLAVMAGRPREDRYSMAENKRLLRRSLKGLLPAEHLAPRSNRTGLPGGYLAEVLPIALQKWFAILGEDLRLADLGLVKPAELRAALEKYLRNPAWEAEEGLGVFNVLSAEFWIRDRVG